jgi:hypothetical protein
VDDGYSGFAEETVGRMIAATVLRLVSRRRYQLRGGIQRKSMSASIDGRFGERRRLQYLGAE